ncbi:Signal transduction histidine kinase [Singulisphaera sp. GP187]|uniref:sensor histidine kinase n=1 Tax=Singulisphaera sp. GP187 TaxID=1882752 RepID=UPI00092B904A|nr:HAMP domain-containing sensor histidine kinase [Singulisphaera sp. GP187]SIO41664.1 Signal transduction histidine kinase [Singulisphaera sp. GP187]
MSLASRLSASFLAALAIVLIGFSAALGGLAVHHLYRLIDERLDSALTTLAAAAEVGPEGVEWEPGERVLGVGLDAGADQIRWVVRDARGRLIDQSPNLNPRRLPIELPEEPPAGRLSGRDGRPWMVKTRRLTVPKPFQEPVEPLEPLASGRHAALILVAYAPLGPTEATLSQLGLTLLGLSTVLWLVAAAVNRRLCRRGLAPLTEMAMAARDADAEDRRERLPVPKTGDELEDLGQAFNGLLDRLHETLQQQRRFTGDASHQLRTPLAGLLGQVDVVLRRDRPPEEYRRVLGIVRHKAVHLQQIIESLLFLARTEAEAGRPEPVVIDLTAWVPEHLEAWSSHVRGTDLKAEATDAGPLWVRVHPLLLAQAVDNLLDNACKYSPPNTPIIVRTGRQADLVSLTVVDQGDGLSPEGQARAFEPFYRAPEATRRDQRGVGLGLAVARRIVTAFGGRISAQGALGQGSRFTIELPIATVPPAVHDDPADPQPVVTAVDVPD